MKNPKHEIRNTKQIQMTEIQNSKQYDLEERTLKFAKRARAFVKQLKNTVANIEDSQVGWALAHRTEQLI